MLSNAELYDVYGGKANYSLIMILGGLVTFIIGVFDGYFNPNKCNR